MDCGFVGWVNSYSQPVLLEDGTEVKKYVGSTKNFKTRWYGHKASFRKEEKRHSTALAAHKWDNDLGPEPEI